MRQIFLEENLLWREFTLAFLSYVCYILYSDNYTLSSFLMFYYNT